MENTSSTDKIEKEVKKEEKKSIFDNMFLSVSVDEQVLFAKELYIMTNAGLPLMQAIETISTQMKSPSFKKILSRIQKDINNGAFLWVSFNKFNKIFGSLFVNIIRVGEESGTLSSSLKYLADELKKRSEIKRKVVGALVYPMVIISLTVLISASMVFFIIPKIVPVFQSMNVKLPLTTRMLIGVSDFIVHQGHFLLLGIIVGFILFRFSLRIKKIQYGVDYFLIIAPLFGDIVKQINVMNICRTFSLLLQSDIKIVEAATITTDTVDNLVYKEELEKITESLKKGNPISKELIANHRLFPDIMDNLVEVGEKTGDLIGNFKYLAEYYEAEVDNQIKNITVVIEPLLLVTVGVAVGFIAISIIAPIYSLTQTLTI